MTTLFAVSTKSFAVLAADTKATNGQHGSRYSKLCCREYELCETDSEKNITRIHTGNFLMGMCGTAFIASAVEEALARDRRIRVNNEFNTLHEVTNCVVKNHISATIEALKNEKYSASGIVYINGRHYRVFKSGFERISYRHEVNGVIYNLAADGSGTDAVITGFYASVRKAKLKVKGDPSIEELLGFAGEAIQFAGSVDSHSNQHATFAVSLNDPDKFYGAVIPQKFREFAWVTFCEEIDFIDELIRWRAALRELIETYNEAHCAVVQFKYMCRTVFNAALKHAEYTVSNAKELAIVFNN